MLNNLASSQCRERTRRRTLLQRLATVRVPVVLSREDGARLLAAVELQASSLAAILYGAGLRLNLRLLQGPLGPSDGSTAMISTHILDASAAGLRGPQETLSLRCVGEIAVRASSGSIFARTHFFGRK